MLPYYKSCDVTKTYRFLSYRLKFIMIKLHSFGSAFGLIDASPFVTKVKLFMTMHSIEFEEIHDADKLNKAPKQKFPYLEDGQVVIADSDAILKYLSEKHDINMDSWLSDQQLALSHLLSKSLEENLYWCLVQSRWLNEDTWPTVKDHFFGSMPFPLNKIIPKIAKSGTVKRINGHGMGAHTKEEVLAIAEQSFDSLSVLLANKPFFFGDKLCTFDLIAFSQLSAFTLSSLDNPSNRAAKKHANLVNYTKQISKTYYPDL